MCREVLYMKFNQAFLTEHIKAPSSQELVFGQHRQAPAIPTWTPVLSFPWVSSGVMSTVVTLLLIFSFIAQRWIYK